MEKELERIIHKVKEKVKDQEVICLFESTFLDIFTQTMENLEDSTTYMVTGDIPAMWLRDSSCQLRPIIPFLKESPQIAQLVKRIIRRQFDFIQKDPYANAYTIERDPERWDADLPTQNPHVWEQKYEIDSLCFPILLAYQYWKMTEDTSIFDNLFFTSITTIIDLWITEQQHEEVSSYTFLREEEGYLVRDGKGSLTSYTGMTWSGFRPSDDPCVYHYLVPSNLFASHVLGLIEKILAIHPIQQSALLHKVVKLQKEIEKGIQTFGHIENEHGHSVYAYEVDGLGNYLMMDDSNMPSLLSLPMLTSVMKDDLIYSHTRNFVLSEKNPYYFQGEKAFGIGSPHTPEGYVWPIAIAVEGITSTSKTEKWEKIQMISQTTAGQLQIHESFDPDNPCNYTREWFSWANAMFCELVLDYCGYSVLVE
ncbi:glycoside hydrolase family 125 protein [Enterococcus sp.]|uniref:glycoside hydrolase family 125 protein n=1 Tax=Enterococcus sp. TaxID=35783 RepID=UPI002FCB351D